MKSLFISDLHLDESRPGITALFLDFLSAEGASADRLYILGDLFESWIGDDYATDLSRKVARGLKNLGDRGVAVAFLAGNRDFLIGPHFAGEAGMDLLTDPTEISLAGRPALLSHGDSLCTDDIAYQEFRAQVRDPDWQRDFLTQPIHERLAFARQARDASSRHTAAADTRIMDVNPAAVRALMRTHGVDLLIHGHTHRPAIHEPDARQGQRIVLGDWFRQGSVLRCLGNSLELSALPPGSGSTSHSLLRK